MTVPVSDTAMYSCSSPGRFKDKYWIDKDICLAKGRGMTVRVCFGKRTKEKYAVKTVDKTKAKAVGHLRNEIEMMNELSQHPSINRLVDYYEDDQFIYLVSELCTGGHLSNFIHAKLINNPSVDYESHEHEAAFIMKQLIEAISHCHEQGIVHRDLKLENILLRKRRQLDIRLIDFDISTRHDDEKDPKMTKLVGTRAYMAPEVLNREYNSSCDIWSIGVIAHALLRGELPFSGEDSEELTDKIQTFDVSFNSPAWENFSKEAKDFVKGCLEKDPQKRMSVAELVTHEWMDAAFLPSKPEKKLKALKRLRAMFEHKFHSKTKDGVSSSWMSSTAKTLPVRQ